MSIDSARVVCTGCSYETRELYRPVVLRYQTTPGSHVETVPAKGWCYDCAEYLYIENMHPAALRAQLDNAERSRQAVRRRQNELNGGFLSRFQNRSERQQLQYQLEEVDKQITKLTALLDIARGRTSNPRCLKCWSDHTALITFDLNRGIADDFQHECGGHLQIVHDQSGPRFHFRLTTYILTGEGELVREV